MNFFSSLILNEPSKVLIHFYLMGRDLLKLVDFFGFIVYPYFNDCIDGLVVVDMQTLTEKKRKRYLTDIQLKATA